MNREFLNKTFQLWEFQVSHGSLLIRCPQGQNQEANIDLIFTGVEYLAVPRYLRGLKIERAMEQERVQVIELLSKEVPQEGIHVLVSGGSRFLIVASSFEVNENTNDIFVSPFLPRG